MSPRTAAVLRERGGDLREHLVRTAARMIAAGGAVGLTVRAIAREAGVADGVLYNHFADKDELLADAVLAHARAVVSGLGALPTPGDGDLAANLRAHLDHGLALHRAVLPVLAGLVGQPGVLARVSTREGEPPWRARLLDYLRAERDLGRLHPDADVGAAAAVLVGVCHDEVLSAVLGSPAGGPSAGSVVAVVLDGIGARPMG
ncbi:TetR/AcrR family transcriptional regulator [Actinokineospora auranticolor]|uniref:AcrR family transcriptional regulator n=1 Tax=Actinokineospora auranticolor TaxID=155976 RepID=A0A2S6GJX8_9PSEU|nr:TetR/AcrR family transcriptional regulator [Actinokineospora auranticolor]PPK65456.1 AcrR family transcriptional regulator [Actinokineospora auranticolor]